MAVNTKEIERIDKKNMGTNAYDFSVCKNLRAAST